LKKFAWSWSRLKNYRVCPKKHYHVDLAKEFPEPDNEVLIWGNQVHKAMSEYIDKGVKLPPMMEHYDPWPNMLVSAREAGWTVKTELKLAMSESHKPTSFFDNATWFRGYRANQERRAVDRLEDRPDQARRRAAGAQRSADLLALP